MIKKAPQGAFFMSFFGVCVIRVINNERYLMLNLKSVSFFSDEFKVRHVGVFIICVVTVLLLLNIYYPIVGFFGYDAKRSVQITLVVCLHCALLDRTVGLAYREQFLSFSFSVKCLLLILFGFSLLSSFLSKEYLYGFGDWLHYWLLLNTVFVISAISGVLSWVRFAFVGALFLGFVWLLLAFLFFSLFTLVLGQQPINPWNVYPNVANIRFLNQVHIQLFFIFPLLVMMVPARYRLAVMCIGALSAYMLIIGYSRGVQLSLLVVFMLGFWAVKQYKNEVLKELLVLGLKIFFCGFSLYVLLEVYYFFMGMGSNAGHTILRSGGERFPAWLEIVERIILHPLGIGSYHYSGFSSYNFPFSHPHNSVLQFLIEWGIVSGMVVLCFLYLLLSRVVKRVQHIRDHLHLGLLASFLLALFYSLFSGVLVMPASQVTFIVIFGVLMSKGYVFSPTYKTVDVSCNVTSPVLYVPVLVIILSIVMGCYGYYAVRTYQLSQEYSPFDNGSLYKFKTTGPRMWLRGGIVVPIDAESINVQPASTNPPPYNP